MERNEKQDINHDYKTKKNNWKQTDNRHTGLYGKTQSNYFNKICIGNFFSPRKSCNRPESHRLKSLYSLSISTFICPRTIKVLLQWRFLRINPKDSSIKLFNKKTQKNQEYTYLVVNAAKSADRRRLTENIPLPAFHIPSTDPQIGTGKPKSN